MKTYIPRDPKTVEPQNPLRTDPLVTATVQAILGRPQTEPTPKGPAFLIGLERSG